MLLAIGPASALAQTPADVQGLADTQAVAAITAAEVARQLTVLTADSMRQRDTPSHGLELAAQYVAGEMQRLGLEPGVQNKSAWIQRYPIPGQQRVSPTGSALIVAAHLPFRGKSVVDDAGELATRVLGLGLTNATYFTTEVGRQTIMRKRTSPYQFFQPVFTLGEPLVLVTGRHTAASVRQAAEDIQEKVALYIPPAEVDSATRQQVITELYETGKGVIVVSQEDSAGFAAEHAAHQRPVELVDEYLRSAMGPRRWPWAVSVWGAPIRDILQVTGEDWTRLRADTTPAVRALSSVVAILGPVGEGTTVDTVTAPNVVGVVEGTDTMLRKDYLVISARMDTRAGNRAGEDSSRADDNAAGVAGLLAVAKAFSQPGARPRRSVVFLATSGGAKGSWGANYFSDHRTMRWQTTLGRVAIAANLTLEWSGGTSKDSVVIDGLREVEMALSPEWVTAAHPELGLIVADGGTGMVPRADHFAFVRAAVPSLYFHTTEPKAPVGPVTASAPVPAPDAEQVARMARLVFYVAQSMANADRSPRWSAEGQQRLPTVLVP